jgi:hypothetical protein
MERLLGAIELVYLAQADPGHAPSDTFVVDTEQF